MTESISLVLETHNLHAGDTDARAHALTRLLRHLRPQLDACSRAIHVLITHEGPSKGDVASLTAALGREIELVELAHGSSYYDAKNRGFDASRGDIVVFADTDCWPDAAWLERLVAPILDGRGAVSAGRTRYRDDVLGRAVSLLDFLYVTRTSAEGVRFTRNFYANNVAFRRDVFAAHRYREGEPFFRGHCQVLGLELAEARVPIVFVDDAVTVHRFPDRIAELVELRLRRGGDLANLAPRLTSHAGIAIGARTATAVTWLARQAIAHEELKRSEPRLARRAEIECVALAVAALDGLGTVLRRDAREHEALGYLTDRDRLTGDRRERGVESLA